MGFNIQDNITSDMYPQERYIKRASMMNLSRDKRWLTRFKDRLCYIDKEEFKSFDSTIQRDEYFNQFLQLMDVMQRKYEDKWDVKIYYSTVYERYAFTFVILYDKVNITNTAEEKRELLDLFVFLPLTWSVDNQCIYTKLYGGRLTFRYNEWVSRYKHSHLRMFSSVKDKQDLFLATEFCIGSEDVSELVITQQQAFNINNFELLLYTIDNMVAWESTEGTPHFHMRNITSAVVENRMTYNNNNIKSLWETFKSTFSYQLSLIVTNFNYVYTNNRYRIKHDDTINDSIINMLQNNERGDEYLSHRLICKRGVDNHFYQAFAENKLEVSNNFILSLSKEEIPYTYIQSKKHVFKILDINKKQEDIQTNFIIYPKFLDYATEQLEATLYKTCVRGSSINRAYTSINASRDTRQNQVSL